MTEIQKKIELLQRIAQRLNEAHVQWALGASMLLYFKGITSAFHDIPLPTTRCTSWRLTSVWRPGRGICNNPACGTISNISRV